MFEGRVNFYSFIIFFLLILINLSLPRIVAEPNKNVLNNNEMQLIPSGSFEMGSNNGNEDELPVHTVFIDSFYISKTEVTIWEYLECVKSGVVPMPNWWNTSYFDESYYYHKAEGNNNEPSWLDFPITGISWYDAMKFCKWKGEKYRLPTEAEWEYAARAGVKTEYLWGDESAAGDFFDNYDKRALAFANIGGGLQAIASKRPNNYGLYDMTGNVWEWCLDFYDETFYKISAIDNPKGPLKAKISDSRSVRGGSWNEYSFNLRLANRSFGSAEKGYKGVGFRVLYQIEPNIIKVKNK